jgi:hypothetical protein
MIKALYRVDYTEYERGWGQRPDGFTLHISKDDAIKFSNHYENFGDSELFSRASTPQLVEVSDAVYNYFISHKEKNYLWDYEIKSLGLK